MKKGLLPPLVPGKLYKTALRFAALPTTGRHVGTTMFPQGTIFMYVGLDRPEVEASALIRVLIGDSLWVILCNKESFERLQP